MAAQLLSKTGLSTATKTPAMQPVHAARKKEMAVQPVHTDKEKIAVPPVHTAKKKETAAQLLHKSSLTRLTSMPVSYTHLTLPTTPYV